MSKVTKEELARQRELLNKIAELGGRGMKDEDIVYKGTTLVLPERWSGDIGAAIDFLNKKLSEENQTSNFTRTYKYRPWDGAYNAFMAMKKAFGMVHGKTVYTFFGPEPPQYIQVPISITETEEVPWGQFEVPMLKNTRIHFGSKHIADFGQVFQLTITSPRKNRFIIEGLFKLVEDELTANSIYRGKAIDGQTQPQFLDLRGFDEAKVIYSEQVSADLEANLWSVIRYSEANRKMGLPLKRSLLLTGPYGTGKTLGGLRTAVEAVASKWTFLMARPGRDDFTEVMQTARLYQPAVVFMEDVDTIASAENTDYISTLLDLFDGLQSKNTDLIVVLTTNHPEDLHKGMMRPGRLDAIVEIGALDGNGIERLIKSLIGDKLADDIDFDEVAEANADYMPAFVKEGADRAVRYALARNAGNLGEYKITTADLVFAAGGLRSQFDRMSGAKDKVERVTLDDRIGSIVAKRSTKAVADLVTPTNPRPDVWDIQQVNKIRKNGHDDDTEF